MGWPSVDTSHHLPPCRRRVRGGVWCGGGVRCVVVALTDSLYTHHCVAHGTTRGRSRQIRALGLHSLTTQPTGMACACEWPWSGCGAGRSVGHMSLGVCLDMLRISPPPPRSPPQRSRLCRVAELGPTHRNAVRPGVRVRDRHPTSPPQDGGTSLRRVAACWYRLCVDSRSPTPRPHPCTSVRRPAVCANYRGLDIHPPPPHPAATQHLIA
jgi:hypothetical protein